MATKQKQKSEETEVRQIEHVISVQGGKDAIYLVVTLYAESDPLQAVGQVLRDGLGREDEATVVLNANDTLACMWRSPTGALWVGSARGNAWTTAQVEWPAPRTAWLDFDRGDGDLDWKVTTLPELKKRGFPGNVTAIWGTSDTDVHAGTFQGAIYRWDGKAWKEMATGVQTGINHIHGSSPTDIWAVGDRGVLLHWDGNRWKRVPYPSDAGDGDALTGVRATSAAEVFACGRAGRVLHGSAEGLEILTESSHKLYGIARLQKRLLLAAGDDGVVELKRNRLVVIRDTFASVGVFEFGASVLGFVEPAQDEGPAFVEYDPRDKEDPWWRRGY